MAIKSTEHTFDAQYQIQRIQVTPAFRNFLSAPGIVFKIWAPVFDSVEQMPPIIAYKIRSKKVTLTIKLPDGDSLKLKCKTGNSIGSLKRKIEFRTEIGDYQQMLFYRGEKMENARTLLDYEVSDGDTIITKILGDNKDSAAPGGAAGPQQFFVKRTSLMDLEPEDVKKELTNPDLSAEERSRIRRIKNKSIHMAFLKEDLVHPESMTLESYKEENAKLREELKRANQRIENLERELAAAKSTHSGSSQRKVFGSWRKRKNADAKAPLSLTTPESPTGQ